MRKPGRWWPPIPESSMQKVARACEEVLGIGTHAVQDKLEHLSEDTREALKIKLGSPHQSLE